MPKHYSYRVRTDKGFAPHIESGICTLSGCKDTTIEKWAEQGSWVIGIGGNDTGKPNKIIYAMKVEENLEYNQFKKQYPKISNYLNKDNAGENVLISHKFFYFGDKAIDIPKGLEEICIKHQGCKCVSEENISKLKSYLEKNFPYGKIGNPNNINENKNCNYK